MIDRTTPRLAVGSAAPAFQTVDVFDNPVRLSDYVGRPLLLSFYRNGACALCNVRVHQLIQKYPTYHAQGLEMLAIFESPRESILQYVGKQDAPFQIVADPTAALYDLYGVETSEAKLKASLQNPATQTVIAEAAAVGFALTPEEGSNFNRMPADFLIDGQGIIRDVVYAEYVGQHLGFEAIEAYLNG